MRRELLSELPERGWTIKREVPCMRSRCSPLSCRKVSCRESHISDNSGKNFFRTSHSGALSRRTHGTRIAEAEFLEQGDARRESLFRDPKLVTTSQETDSSVILLPGNMSHFHWAKSGDYIAQVTAIGPLGVEYINSKDDPRNDASRI